MSFRLPPHATRRQGQSLVEFALVLPAFLLIALVVIDAGRAVYTWNTVSQAAREGARRAAVLASATGRPGPCNVPYCPATTSDLTNQIAAAANGEAVGLSSLSATSNVSVQCQRVPGGAWGACAWSASDDRCFGTSNMCPGDLVRVTVTYPFALTTPVVSQVFGSPTMGASATMTIN